MAVNAVGDIGFFGMNSGIDPQTLEPGMAFRLQNIITRGSIARTRPGFKSIYNLPPGQPQGFEIYTPTGDLEHLVFAVDGDVFASRYPFTEYRQLPNIKFSPNSKFVVFQVCQQTTAYDDDGNFYVLNEPRSMILMQDGNTRAAYWDGSVSRHLNPTASSGTVSLPNRDETPIGLWMSWVADRLMVFRGNLGFASDIGNPLKFTESQYIAEGRGFTFPDDVTGAVQPYAGLPLLVFTGNSITRLRVDIRDRSQWIDIPDFQQTDYNIGCVSGRSIVRSFGQVWWFSEFGVTNFNAAMQINQDSRFQHYDNEMAYSKGNLSPVLDQICAASFENFLLFSVPYGDRYNRHTWVLDQMQTPAGNAAWTGFWTGIRPVEWASGNIQGEQRIFAMSHDMDGINRMWEAFDDSNTDNGCPITSFIETRQYNNGNQVNKEYRHTKFFITDIEGEVDCSVYVGATRGPYNRIIDRRVTATVGGIGDSIGNSIQSFKSQNRVFVTPQNLTPNDGCNSCGVESLLPNNIDVAFSHLVVWSGSMAVRGVQMFFEDAPGHNQFESDCPEDEDGVRIVTTTGCGTMDEEEIPNGFTIFSATAGVDVVRECPEGNQEAFGTGFADSTISQADADRKALCAATADGYSKTHPCDPPETPETPEEEEEEEE